MDADVMAVIENCRRWAVAQGDAADVLATAPDGVVHCCVTSPPYAMLRSYLPADHADKSREIGSEATVGEYLERLVAIFREVRRVLHPTGTLFVNIGDGYSSSGKSGKQNLDVLGEKWAGGGHKNSEVATGRAPTPDGMREGELLGVPWRFAEAMRADGWKLRDEIQWCKLAPMPSSLFGWRWERCRRKTGGGWSKDNHPAAIGINGGRGEGRVSGGVGTGKKVGVAEWESCPGCRKCSENGGYVLRRGSWRTTRAHEQIFLFAKDDRYYADGEPVRTRLADATVTRDTYSRITSGKDGDYAVQHDHETPSNEAGANLRSWLALGPTPNKLALCKACREYFPSGPPKKRGKMRCPCGGTEFVFHYASFPASLPSICIRAGSSDRGVCPSCLAPWARVLEGGKFVGDLNPARKEMANRTSWDGAAWAAHHAEFPTKTTGWRPTCRCAAAEPIPSLILDPFAGSCTTLLEATRLGRRAVGVELSQDYAELGRHRVGGDSPLFDAVAASE